MTVETENFAKLGEDLILLLSLSKEEIEAIVNILLEFTKKTNEISLDRIMDRLKKVNAIDETGASSIARLTGWIARFCTDDEKTEAFIQSVKPWLRSEESVKQLSVILKQLRSKGIINGIFKYNKQLEIESIGMPRFESLDLNTDYRMFTDLEGTKKIVPIILFSIIMEKLPIRQQEQHVFQTSLEDLQYIIKYLNEFSDNLQKDIHFLKDKSISLVE